MGTSGSSSGTAAQLVPFAVPLPAGAAAALGGLAARHRRHPADPLRAVLSISGNMWSTLILEVLGTGSYRYGHLRKIVSMLSCEGTIPAPVLTANLRNLEENGLVHRETWSSVPRRVEYSLTALGASFASIMGRIVRWAEDNCEEIQRSREDFLEKYSDDCDV